MSRVAVIVFYSDEQEMRLRAALYAAKRGDAGLTGELLVDALQHGYIDVMSSAAVVSK